MQGIARGFEKVYTITVYEKKGVVYEKSGRKNEFRLACRRA